MLNRLVPTLANGLVLAALTSTAAIGQPSDLVTDRPDQTESAVTVAPGQYQIETGLLISEDNEAVDISTTEILGTLVRIGLTERIEIRTGFDGFISRKVDSPGGFSIRDEGLGDSLLGAKILLSEASGERPQLALLVETSVPTGESDVSSDDWEPSIILAAGKDLEGKIGLGANLGVAEQDGDSVLLYSFVAGYDVNSTNGAFIELFGDSEDSHSIDTGWTHLLSPTTQWDVAVGFGLTDEAPDWFAGLGLVVRFPN